MMKIKEDFQTLEEKAVKKTELRRRKKKPKMNVSGKTVFKLKEIIGKKAVLDDKNKLD